LPAHAVSASPVGTHMSRDVEAYVREVSRSTEGDSPTVVFESPQAETKTTSRASILVVDDNADLRGYIAGLLKPFYDVTTAHDGLEALSSLQSHVPDIVISDVMMPRLDGFGLVRELRADPTTRLLPVILLSARAGEELAIEGLDAGCDDYLVKPFSARELLARVNTHVKLATSRRKWITELELANQELDSFSYSVSHDLRAPLRAIDGFTRALVEDYESALDERARGYTSRIQQGVRRMTDLIDALLELARITRTPLREENVDLTSLANEVTADLREQDPQRVVTLDISEGLMARGDKRLLRVVLVNLLGNAWKFTSACASPRICVGALPAEEPTFFVRDNGAGFDMAYANRLFSPFQRLHDAQEFEGTGVGLATVRRVIARHHGRIWAESIKGEGATFFWSLPLNTEDDLYARTG
jgi:signal transduction histidine kinase